MCLSFYKHHTSKEMKNKKSFVDIMLYTLVLIILVTGIFTIESTLKNYIAGICIALILIIIHIFMPHFAGLDSDNPKVRTMRRYNFLMGMVIIISFALHNIFPQKTVINDDKFIVLLVVAITLLVGNAAPKLPINSIIGIRLPWTMCDQDTWGIAHRVLGYCSFPVAIIMTIGGLYINPVIFSVGGLVVLALIPSIYSCVYYYKKKSM